MERKPRGIKNMTYLSPAQVNVGSKVYSGINKRLTTALADSVDMAVAHFELNSAVDTTLAQDYWGRVIDAWAAAKGYDPSLSTDTIASYLLYAQRAIDVFITLYRQQNISEIRDADGVDISTLYGSLPDNGTNSHSASGVTSAFVNNANFAQGMTAISNASWARDYLAELSTIYIPKQVYELSKYWFGNVFANPGMTDSPVDSDILFWPSILDAGIEDDSELEGEFAEALTQMKALVTANRNLLPILKYMGWHTYAADDDWTRDLKGQSMKHVLDANLKTFFYNNWILLDSGLAEADIAQEIQDTIILPYAPNKHIGNYDDMLEFNMNNFMYAGFYRFQVRALALNSVQSDGDFQHHRFILPGFINYGGNTISAQGATAVTKLTDAMSVVERLLGHPSVFRIMYVPADTNLASVSVQTSTAFSYVGVSAIECPEGEIDVMKEITTLSLIFGPEYRSAVQSLVDGLIDNLLVG